MNQLAIDQMKYKFIPPAAAETFESYVDIWYFGNCEESVTPHILDNLFHNDDWALHYLLWIHREVSEYYFNREAKHLYFDPDVFSVDRTNWSEDDYENAGEYYLDNYNKNEMFFYIDMKRLLNKNHMFYLDSYAGNVFSKKPQLINPPIKGVW
ncbi:hypothetical protein [Priestia megaterium]|uniref:hypothetical protein n=1 Tax=Priestia megaterium TaxID=1404 RepID=UPI000BFD039B|nr:hypothetical protein [Priestia megaterium]PGQ88229.1 hypothetical protein COA18_04700 [Priestia megaterium]